MEMSHGKETFQMKGTVCSKAQRPQSRVRGSRPAFFKMVVKYIMQHWPL